MTEKRQKLVSKCFGILHVLDVLDEIADSDYDNVDLLRKCKQNRNSDISVSTPAASKQLAEQADRKYGPTKGLLDGQNPMEVLSNEQFVKCYRFSKECVADILQMISYGLTKFTNRGKPFSPISQLLITLQFLTTGL